MKTQSEIEAALRYAREKYTEATRKCFDNKKHTAAYEVGKMASITWASRIDAYELVLGLEAGAHLNEALDELENEL